MLDHSHKTWFQPILTWAETMLMATLVRWSLAGTVAIPMHIPVNVKL